MLHKNALQRARIHELKEQLAVMTKRKSRKRKRLQTGSTLEYSVQRRLVVVVIKKQPNQLYGAVGTAAGLGTTRERARRIQRHLLNQMPARRTQAPCLIAIKLKIYNMCWLC
ncbi:hypothetical protein BKA63DRAFT_435333, partial [Paraphoma chrysanthemicola]